MFNFLTLLLFLLALLILTFAQEIHNMTTTPSVPSLWDSTTPIIRPNGRIGITNRALGGINDSMVDFHITGLSGPAQYLEFQATKSEDKDLFTLIRYYGVAVATDPVFLPGRGEFKATWAGQDKEAICHLERNNDALLSDAETKFFTFMPGGTGSGSYVWPCVSDWVKVVCVGNEPTCKPEGW